MRLVRGLPKSLPIRAVSGSVDFLKKLTPAVVRTAKSLAGQPCTEECSWHPMCVCVLFLYVQRSAAGTQCVCVCVCVVPVRTEERSWHLVCLFLYVHGEYEQQGRFRAMYVAIVQNAPE